MVLSLDDGDAGVNERQTWPNTSCYKQQGENQGASGPILEAFLSNEC